jgi:hypothetical protein
MAVSQALLIDPDFIPLRAALVRKLGAMEAIVWQLVYFRTAQQSPHRYERDGQSWWRANREELSQASGLSSDQIKRVIAKLEKSGHLVAAEHRDGGITDRTKSYRCVTDESAQSSGANPPSQERGDSAQSSSKKSEEVSTSYSPRADGSAHSELFEQAWKHWPKKEARKPAFEKFQRLVRDRRISAEELAAEIIRHGDAFAASGRQVQYVPGLLPWLNQERWSDDLAQPTAAQPKQTAFHRNLSTVDYFAGQEHQHEQDRALPAARNVLPR